MYRRACVKWCPQNDYMVVVGSDVQAFRAVPAVSAAEDRLGVLTRRSFAPLSLSAEVQQTTSAEWDPVKHESSARLAVGTTGGMMVLMEASLPGSRGSLCREYSPLSSVECLDLAWNPMSTNQVAMGLNNGGTPSCGLVLWDLESSQGTAAADAALMGARSGGVPPVWSTLRGSAVASVDWRPRERHQLLAGLASTWVKLMDTRSSTPSLSLAVHEEHRRIVDVRVDPWNPLRFFTAVADGSVKVWDIRHHRARRPLALIPPEGRPSPFLEAAWSPVHAGRLLLADGSPAVVSLWDTSSLELEPSSSSTSSTLSLAATATTPHPSASSRSVAGGAGGPGDPWASRGEDGKVASVGALPTNTMREPLLQRALGTELVGFSWMASRVAQPSRPGRGNRIVTVAGDGVPSDVALQSCHPVTFSVQPTSRGPTVGRGRAVANPAMATSLSAWFAPDVATRCLARLEQGVCADAAKNESIFADACKRLRHTGERASSLSLAARLLEGGQVEDEQWRHRSRRGGHDVDDGGGRPPAPSDEGVEMEYRGRSFWSSDQAMASPFLASLGAAERQTLIPPLSLPPNDQRPGAAATGAGDRGDAAGADMSLLGEVDAGCGEGAHGGRDKVLLPGTVPAARRGEVRRGAQVWRMAAAADQGGDAAGGKRTGVLYGAIHDTHPHGDNTATTAVNEADVRYEMYRQARDVHDLRAAWAFVRATTESAGDNPTDASIGHGVMAHLEEERSHPGLTEECHIGPFVGYTCGARRHILSLCGWATERQSLSALCRSCAVSAGKERAAALAVFHGNVALALTLLQSAVADRGEEATTLAEARVQGPGRPEWSAKRGDQLRRAEQLLQQEKECLQMVTMALVGFPGVGGAPPLAEEASPLADRAGGRGGEAVDDEKEETGRRDEGDLELEGEEDAVTPAGRRQAGNLWRRLCRQLIARMDREHPYLRAMCAFLLAQADPAVRRSMSAGEGEAGDAAAAENSEPADWRASPLVGVLTERGIRLADRVAIGAQFLGPLAFPTYVEALMNRATKEGFVDGLLLTGLGTNGVALLQEYVNRTGDTQMAALLSCFVPPSRVRRRSAQRMMVWIHAYRDLLNRWKLWRVRAYFDIGRSKQMRALMRVPAEVPTPLQSEEPRVAGSSSASASSFELQRLRQLQQDFVGPETTPKAFNLRGSSARERLASRASRTATFSRGLRTRGDAGGGGSSGGGAGGGRVGALSLRAAVTRTHDLGGLHSQIASTAARPHAGEGGSARADGGDPAACALLLRTLTHHPQLHLVCQCGQSQALPSLIKSETIGRPYVGDQFPPILLTCPKCKNRLPRCALCLLGMGSINPLLERQHQSVSLRQGTRTAQRGTALESEHPTRRSALNFAEHWTWCQACQHGGHASHLAEWFASHDVCPVSGCRCQCKLRDRAVVPWNESLLGPRWDERGRHDAQEA